MTCPQILTDVQLRLIDLSAESDGALSMPFLVERFGAGAGVSSFTVRPWPGPADSYRRVWLLLTRAKL